MSFVQRELDRVSRALQGEEEGTARRDALYVAQQALAWALDPDRFRSPYDMITSAPVLPATGIPASSEDLICGAAKLLGLRIRVIDPEASRGESSL